MRGEASNARNIHWLPQLFSKAAFGVRLHAESARILWHGAKSAAVFGDALHTDQLASNTRYRVLCLTKAVASMLQANVTSLDWHE
jgi:hypothetical protein